MIAILPLTRNSAILPTLPHLFHHLVDLLVIFLNYWCNYMQLGGFRSATWWLILTRHVVRSESWCIVTLLYKNIHKLRHAKYLGLPLDQLLIDSWAKSLALTQRSLHQGSQHGSTLIFLTNPKRVSQTRCLITILHDVYGLCHFTGWSIKEAWLDSISICRLCLLLILWNKSGWLGCWSEWFSSRCMCWCSARWWLKSDGLLRVMMIEITAPPVWVMSSVWSITFHPVVPFRLGCVQGRETVPH